MSEIDEAKKEFAGLFVGDSRLASEHKRIS